MYDGEKPAREKPVTTAEQNRRRRGRGHRKPALALGDLIKLAPQVARVRILDALQKSKGNMAATARRLHVGGRIMRYYCERLGLIESQRALQHEDKTRFRLPKVEEH